MTKETKQHYRVEVSTPECSVGTFWAIVEDVNGKPVEMCGTTWGDKEAAEDICDLVNKAFENGRESRQ